MNKPAPPPPLRHPAEVRERHFEMEWLHRQAEHRRPEKNRGRSDYGDRIPTTGRGPR